MLEPDLQGVANSSSWCLKIGDWYLLEFVLKRREIGVSYKLYLVKYINFMIVTFNSASSTFLLINCYG